MNDNFHCLLDGNYPAFRTSKRTRNCRSCNTDIPGKTPAIIWWAGFQRGTIVVCADCVKQMYEATKNEPLPPP